MCVCSSFDLFWTSTYSSLTSKVSLLTVWAFLPTQFDTLKDSTLCTKNAMKRTENHTNFDIKPHWKLLKSFLYPLSIQSGLFYPFLWLKIQLNLDFPLPLRTFIFSRRLDYQYFDKVCLCLLHPESEINIALVKLFNPWRWNGSLSHTNLSLWQLPHKSK